MKYTVTIQQPVREDRRRKLEQQLAERFNLTSEQATRLSSRRAGRLMKPTSRARAELLLDVFQLAGAAVALEEVHDETQIRNEPFQALNLAPAPTPTRRTDTPDEVVLAPLLPPPAWPSPLETSDPAQPIQEGEAFQEGQSVQTVQPARTTLPPSFTADPFALWPDGPDAGAVNWQGEELDGLLDAPPSGVTVITADPHDPFSSVPPDAFAPTGSSTMFPIAQPKTLGVPPTLPPAGTQDPPPVDVWSDFTGSLTLTDNPAAPASGGPDSGAGDALNAVVVPATDPAADSRGPRRSLSRQLMLGMLAPLALSSAVTLGLLALALPAAERQATQQQAQTLAATVGASLNSARAGGAARSNAQLNAQLSAQLTAIAATPGVGFVRAESASGQVTLRTQDTGLRNRNGALSTWLGSHPTGGTLKIGQTQYAVAQYAVAQIPAAPQGAQILRKVVVGVPQVQTSSVLRTTLLLALLSALLGLALAGWLAARATRQITAPIDRLVKAADAISMGDLSRPVQADRNDEIGDLAVTLERMRQSLEAAMERLRRRRKS
ncbi:HAMP domain-containing protein [Deinococcus arenicola]|uniref:HAMP domain-containing protein n=1 Tax=Deinococcus arenicola TaxID=2994950 RepID=A0ABU4DP19_9DEIO|nr:HAMP domain-containing protein [Deinococcus sp. ZS9-10]MDV6374178.1 HAMP domain-containing protein [Deinococcus sp. ZS9-10]